MRILPRERRVREMLAQEIDWTPRQREVLDLLARGKSNQEIAEALGVSLDGAKWHLREILSKLNANTREEAAAYWRLHNGLPARTGRALGALRLGSMPWALGGAAVVVLAAVATLALVLALRGSDDPGGSPDGDPSPSPGASASATPSPSVTPSPNVTPSPTGSPTTTPSATVTATVPAGTPRTIVLDTSPQPQPPETTRPLGDPPDSVFPPWDGESTVIYDVATGRYFDLGPGAQPASFSPDETMAAWAAGDEFAQGSEVLVIDLQTGEQRSLGEGRFAQFLIDGTVLVSVPGTGNTRTLVAVDPITGERTPYDPGDEKLPPYADASDISPSAPPGYRVDPDRAPGPQVRTYTVFDMATGAAVLTFEAIRVAAAGPGEIAVVAPPVNGQSNVYLVDLATGTATFVAVAVPGKDNFPFSATADAVLWTDEYCGSDGQGGGMVSYYDRATDTLTRIATQGIADPGEDMRWVQLTADGLIAFGSFGAKYLVDPVTLDYVTNIPSRPDGYGGDVWWSINHRFASHGPYGGHGGLCSG